MMVVRKSLLDRDPEQARERAEAIACALAPPYEYDAGKRLRDLAVELVRHPALGVSVVSYEDGAQELEVFVPGDAARGVITIARNARGDQCQVSWERWADITGDAGVREIADSIAAVLVTSPGAGNEDADDGDERAGRGLRLVGDTEGCGDPVKVVRMSAFTDTRLAGEAAAVPDLVGDGIRPVVKMPAPNVARMYDYLLGGKDNFASDRHAAIKLMRAVPEILQVCHYNREFLRRAVGFLARAGIRQFIDIGTGLPTRGSVHEVAHATGAAARVVYVDNDPVVISHAQSLIKSPAVVAVNGDLREPRQILNNPALRALIDLGEPVAVLLVAVLHFIPDDADPYGVVAELGAAMPAGSYVVVSHATGDGVPAAVTDRVRAVYRRANAPAAPRTRAGILRFFDGLDLVDPGLVSVDAWPDPARAIESAKTIFLAGIGRKP